MAKDKNKSTFEPILSPDGLWLGLTSKTEKTNKKPQEQLKFEDLMGYTNTDPTFNKCYNETKEQMTKLNKDISKEFTSQLVREYKVCSRKILHMKRTRCFNFTNDFFQTQFRNLIKFPQEEIKEKNPNKRTLCQLGQNQAMEDFANDHFQSTILKQATAKAMRFPSFKNFFDRYQ